MKNKATNIYHLGMTMNLNLLRICVPFLFFAVATCADPQLEIAPAVMEIKPSIDDVVGSYQFHAKNINTKSIVIKEFKGGCGCMSFKSSLSVLEPGQSADVTVIFDFKDYTGPQQRNMALLTQSSDDHEPVKNAFQITGEIPSAIHFSKKAAVWLYGEKPITKNIEISVVSGYEITDLHVEDVNLNHFIRVEQVWSEEKKILQISIAPVTTDMNEVSPTEKQTLQIPYVIKYKTKAGVNKYERLWVLIAKRPQPSEPVNKK